MKLHEFRSGFLWNATGFRIAFSASAVYTGENDAKGAGGMKQGLLSVGEMARFSGIPAKTLRYYDEIGLLRPDARDERTAYRFYSSYQLEQALLLKSLKSMDMPLEEIKAEFDNMSSTRYAELLQASADRIDREIADLQRQRRNYSDWIAEVREAVGAQLGVCEIRRYGEMRGYFYPARIRSRDELELAMRGMEQRYGGGTHVGRVIRVVPHSGLLSGDCSTYSGFFIPESSVPPMDGGGAVIPGGEYAVVFAPATHEESPPYWEKLTDYAARRGYAIAGDGYRAIPIEMGISRRERDYICKIFFPVRRARG